MEKKPWPIIILAILHLLEPISKTFFLSLLYGFENVLYTLQLQFQNGEYRELFEFFLIFPIMGLSIYVVKKWSLIVFLIGELWVIISNIKEYKLMFELGQYMYLVFWLIFLVANLLIVVYFLKPAIRVAYLHPRIRWWEAKFRYILDIPCKIKSSHDAMIKNISETGVFLVTQSNIDIDETFDCEFEYLQFKISSQVKAVHKFSVNGQEGYGLQFQFKSLNEKRIVSYLINFLEKNNVDRRPKRVDNWVDFKDWARNLLKTGEGLYPAETQKFLNKD